MDRIAVFSHAKVNLTLEVGARREDGYHDIDSVVQVIDIADELVLSKAPEGVLEVKSDTPDVPSGAGNLVYKACEAFFKSAGLRAGVRCELTKRIPAQAGLGGGSGNAAAAIVGLNRLYECGLSRKRLAETAANAGSDAPLFVYGGTVRMRGRGELIDPLPDAPQMALVVVKPKAGASTAWAYAELDRSPNRIIDGRSESAESAVRTGDREALIRNLYNDFDEVVSAALDEVARAKALLMQNGAQGAMLSGSGSAVFGVFENETRAKQAAADLATEFSKVFVTRTLPRQE